ncbi:PREDICTED: uncharacterized protein LOC106805376 [Priapulus caudatus]|uniref:Uncharacterized protein LOC106805376 n=1 Tax=Priapulus caudatus TaxID=37621 RepID=A0ABM1DR54_PRICU|nr:PREDICTED: uncharacterized protein LOC106805376 [Priapulus caudatus]
MGNRRRREARRNQNGCPIHGTFFVSHEYTDYSVVQSLYYEGHEIGAHSITKRIPSTFWGRASAREWSDELADQRVIIGNLGLVYNADVVGVRAPYLQVGGEPQFEMMAANRFMYDASMTTLQMDPPLWPYTLDHGTAHKCLIPPCPLASYSGLWEVPIISLYDNGRLCNQLDQCSSPQNRDDALKLLTSNFDRHYNTNKAPMQIILRPRWFYKNHYNLEALQMFIEDMLTNKPDVYFVTIRQALEWIKDPTPVSQLSGFKPWQCTSPTYKIPPCKFALTCGYQNVTTWPNSPAHKGERYISTCADTCPEVYPFVGNPEGALGVPYSYTRPEFGKRVANKMSDRLSCQQRELSFTAKSAGRRRRGKQGQGQDVRSTDTDLPQCQPETTPSAPKYPGGNSGRKTNGRKTPDQRGNTTPRPNNTNGQSGGAKTDQKPTSGGSEGQANGDQSNQTDPGTSDRVQGPDDQGDSSTGDAGRTGSTDSNEQGRDSSWVSLDPGNIPFGPGSIQDQNPDRRFMLVTNVQPAANITNNTSSGQIDPGNDRQGDRGITTTYTDGQDRESNGNLNGLTNRGSNGDNSQNGRISVDPEQSNPDQYARNSNLVSPDEGSIPTGPGYALDQTPDILFIHDRDMLSSVRPTANSIERGQRGQNDPNANRFVEQVRDGQGNGASLTAANQEQTFNQQRRRRPDNSRSVPRQRNVDNTLEESNPVKETLTEADVRDTSPPGAPEMLNDKIFADRISMLSSIRNTQRNSPFLASSRRASNRNIRPLNQNSSSNGDGVVISESSSRRPDSSDINSSKDNSPRNRVSTRDNITGNRQDSSGTEMQDSQTDDSVENKDSAGKVGRARPSPVAGSKDVNENIRHAEIGDSVRLVFLAEAGDSIEQHQMASASAADNEGMRDPFSDTTSSLSSNQQLISNHRNLQARRRTLENRRKSIIRRRGETRKAGRDTKNNEGNAASDISTADSTDSGVTVGWRQIASEVPRPDTDRQQADNIRESAADNIRDSAADNIRDSAADNIRDSAADNIRDSAADNIRDSAAERKLFRANIERVASNKDQASTDQQPATATVTPTIDEGVNAGTVDYPYSPEQETRDSQTPATRKQVSNGRPFVMGKIRMLSEEQMQQMLAAHDSLLGNGAADGTAAEREEAVTVRSARLRTASIQNRITDKNTSSTRTHRMPSSSNDSTTLTARTGLNIVPNQSVSRKSTRRIIDTMSRDVSAPIVNLEAVNVGFTLAESGGYANRRGSSDVQAPLVHWEASILNGEDGEASRSDRQVK